MMDDDDGWWSIVENSDPPFCKVTVLQFRACAVGGGRRFIRKAQEAWGTLRQGTRQKHVPKMVVGAVVIMVELEDV